MLSSGGGSPSTFNGQRDITRDSDAGTSLSERNAADGCTPPQPLAARGFAASGFVPPPRQWHRIACVGAPCQRPQIPALSSARVLPRAASRRRLLQTRGSGRRPCRPIQEPTEPKFDPSSGVVSRSSLDGTEPGSLRKGFSAAETAAPENTAVDTPRLRSSYRDRRANRGRPTRGVGRHGGRPLRVSCARERHSSAPFSAPFSSLRVL